MSLLARLRPHRTALLVLSLVGGVGLNGVYLYHALFRPEVNAAAVANPVSAVFMAEALVLTGLAAWVIGLSGLRKPGWPAFVAMSIAGTLAFSVPAFLLWHLRKRGDEPVRPESPSSER